MIDRYVRLICMLKMEYSYAVLKITLIGYKPGSRGNLSAFTKLVSVYKVMMLKISHLLNDLLYF